MSEAEFWKQYCRRQYLDRDELSSASTGGDIFEQYRAKAGLLMPIFHLYDALSCRHAGTPTVTQPVARRRRPAG